MPTSDDHPGNLVPDKPFSEMTREERDAFQRMLNRQIRDRQLAIWRRKPRTDRETRIFIAAIDKREAQTKRLKRRAEDTEPEQPE